MTIPIISVREFIVSPVETRIVKEFIEKWHYSHNINGVTASYCFALYRGEEMIGAALFGLPATPGVAEAYNDGGRRKLIELRRLVCIDDTPRNTESFFIGKMIRWLKQNTDIELILSYADTTYGHSGVIYKATNFKLIGQSPAMKKILFNGKLYHDKSLRTTYKGHLKPFSERLKQAVASGAATWVKTKPKNIYLMELR